jgi:hypothetical protein
VLEADVAEREPLQVGKRTGFSGRGSFVISRMSWKFFSDTSASR